MDLILVRLGTNEITMRKLISMVYKYEGKG
jgi:hypothetical protein